MQAYKHAVGPALDKELTKMFVTYQALVLINKSDIPPGCSFFRFFLFLKLNSPTTASSECPPASAPWK